MSRAWGRKKLWREKGVRSKLEDRLIGVLKANDIPHSYEPEVWEYTIPERVAKYTVDLEVEGVYYEIKGRFDAEDRKKMRLIREQHGPCFIMVFSKPENKISAKSKTTYAAWCEANDIPWMSAEDFEAMYNGRVQE